MSVDTPLLSLLDLKCPMLLIFSQCRVSPKHVLPSVSLATVALAWGMRSEPSSETSHHFGLVATQQCCLITIPGSNDWEETVYRGHCQHHHVTFINTHCVSRSVYMCLWAFFSPEWMRRSQWCMENEVFHLYYFFFYCFPFSLPLCFFLQSLPIWPHHSPPSSPLLHRYRWRIYGKGCEPILTPAAVVSEQISAAFLLCTCVRWRCTPLIPYCCTCSRRHVWHMIFDMLHIFGAHTSGWSSWKLWRRYDCHKRFRVLSW